LRAYLRGVLLQEDGLTQLHIACSGSGSENIEIVRLLLEALADPNARSTEDDSYLSRFLVRLSSRFNNKRPNYYSNVLNLFIAVG